MTEAGIYAIWAAFGPLLGVALGAWLAARWQRQQWTADNKKTEYRDLLRDLEEFSVRARPLIAFASMPLPSRPPLNVSQLMELNVTANSLIATLESSLFIQSNLKGCAMKDRVSALVSRLNDGKPVDRTESLNVLVMLRECAIRAAERDLR